MVQQQGKKQVYYEYCLLEPLYLDMMALKGFEIKGSSSSCSSVPSVLCIACNAPHALGIL